MLRINPEIVLVFPDFFIFTFIFAQLVKDQSNFFSHIFMKICSQPNFMLESLKVILIFPIFFIFIFIFCLSQKSVKIKSVFFLRLSWKFREWPKYLGWRVQKSCLFSKISSSSLFSQLVENRLDFFFSLRFSWKFVYDLILRWGVQNPTHFPIFLHLHLHFQLN